MIRYLLSRIGCLMSLVGVILFIVGFAAFRSGHSAFDYLLIGAGLTILGYFLWHKLRERNRKSTRFSLFRKRNMGEDDEQKVQDDGWNTRR